MATRPKRGKQMPSNNESDSESSDASDDSFRSGEDEIAFVEGFENAKNAAAAAQITATEPERRDTDITDADADTQEDHDQDQDQDIQDQDIQDQDIAEEEEEEFMPPPTPGTALVNRRRETEPDDIPLPLDIRDRCDLGKVYGHLISTCNDLASDNTTSEDFHKVLTKNIETAQVVLDRLIKGDLTNPNEDIASRNRIGGPGDIMWAYRHTAAASAAIRAKAESIGSGPVIFSLEEFLDTLKKEYVDESCQYSPKLAAANIAMQSCVGSKALLPLVAAIGTYDRDAVSIPKPKKPEPIRRTNRKTDEEPQEGTTVDDGNSAQVVENDPAESKAKGMNKILKRVYRQSMQPANLFEFVMDRGSFPRTIENLFYFGFLVKDGHVSLTKDENGRLQDLSLNIKPEKSQILETKSPDEGEGTRNQTNRQTYILSFSPRHWKNLCAMSQGEDTIQYFQNLLDKEHVAD